MNGEMLAAIGQLAAVFIGIPSLIYLAVQIREQTKERRQSAVNALTMEWGELTRALHESADFSTVYVRGVQDFAGLDGVSKLRFSAFENRFSRISKGCISRVAEEFAGVIDEIIARNDKPTAYSTYDLREPIPPNEGEKM